MTDISTVEITPAKIDSFLISLMDKSALKSAIGKMDFFDLIHVSLPFSHDGGSFVQSNGKVIKTVDGQERRTYTGDEIVAFFATVDSPIMVFMKDATMQLPIGRKLFVATITNMSMMSNGKRTVFKKIISIYVDTPFPSLSVFQADDVDGTKWAMLSEPERVIPEFDPEQLAIGTSIELEHTSDREYAEKIARDHLRESKNYYIELIKMEKKLDEKKVEVEKKVKSKKKEVPQVPQTVGDEMEYWTCRSSWGDDRFKIGVAYPILEKFKKDGKDFVKAQLPDGSTQEVPANYFNPWNFIRKNPSKGIIDESAELSREDVIAISDVPKMTDVMEVIENRVRERGRENVIPIHWILAELKKNFFVELSDLTPILNKMENLDQIRLDDDNVQIR